MLILCTGSDTYRLREGVAALASAHPDSSRTTVDLAVADSREELERALKYPSFFETKRLLVAHQPAAADGIIELLENYAVSASGNIILIAVQATPAKVPAELKKRIALIAKLASDVRTYEPLGGRELTDWIARFCGQRGRSMRPEASQELVRRTEADSWKLANELEKLCAYVDSEITIEAVKTLVAPQQQYDEWELSNAVTARNKRLALTALWRRVREGVPEQLLLGTVASSLRNLLMVGDLSRRGHSAGAIAGATGLHPYVASTTLKNMAAHDEGRVRRAHTSISRLDRLAKTGGADAVDGLFGIILEL